jgi:hypothetical protein
MVESARLSLYFVQIPRKFTETPPGIEVWGQPSADHASGAGDQAAFAPRLAVGMQVEGFFKLPDASADSKGDWFPGKITSQNADGTWKVTFEDGDEGDYKGLDDDFRLASGPWESWLDAYLPDLLISAYRAARRDPSRMHKLEPVQSPERFCDTDEVLSCAGTPGQAKRFKGM